MDFFAEDRCVDTCFSCEKDKINTGVMSVAPFASTIECSVV